MNPIFAKDPVLSEKQGVALLTTTFALPGSTKPANIMPVIFRVLEDQDAVQTTFFIDEDTKPRSLTLLMRDYNQTWRLFANNSFQINTPHGALVVCDKGDYECPGVTVELISNQIPNNPPVSLATVEYVPNCNESENWVLYKALRKNSEIPPERLVESDDYSKQDQITAGFITTTWPDDIHQPDVSQVTFHYGYNRPWQSREELETEERRAFNRLCDAETRYGKLAPETKQARDAWEQAKRNLALVRDFVEETDREQEGECAEFFIGANRYLFVRDGNGVVHCTRYCENGDNTEVFSIRDVPSRIKAFPPVATLFVNSDFDNPSALWSQELLNPEFRPSVYMREDGALYCRKCHCTVPNTANNEMRKEGFFAHSHVCGIRGVGEIYDEPSVET